MTDSPLKLAHIEEYRRQKKEAEPKIVIETDCLPGYWHILLVAETPRGNHVAGEMIYTKSPFLQWRLNRAKRRLLKQWRIVCEMES
jgi:hypothetical protein